MWFLGGWSPTTLVGATEKKKTKQAERSTEASEVVVGVFFFFLLWTLHPMFKMTAMQQQLITKWFPGADGKQTDGICGRDRRRAFCVTRHKLAGWPASLAFLQEAESTAESTCLSPAANLEKWIFVRWEGGTIPLVLPRDTRPPTHAPSETRNGYLIRSCWQIDSSMINRQAAPLWLRWLRVAGPRRSPPNVKREHSSGQTNKARRWWHAEASQHVLHPCFPTGWHEQNVFLTFLTCWVKSLIRPFAGFFFSLLGGPAVNRVKISGKL